MISGRFKICFAAWAIGLLIAQPVYGQNYARYCARDTDQLANDLTNAITSQDENYIATLYYWAGFSSETAYRKMDDFIKMSQRTLISVDPIGSGVSYKPRTLVVRFLTAGLGFLSALPPPPVEDTPEIGPYIEDNDPRGLGRLPDLPQDDVYVAEPTAPDPWLDTDKALAESRRKAEEFDRQLRKELDAMQQSDGWVSSVDGGGFGTIAKAIRVEQEEGRIRAKKVFTVFGIIKYEDCYWLTGG